MRQDSARRRAWSSSALYLMPMSGSERAGGIMVPASSGPWPRAAFRQLTWPFARLRWQGGSPPEGGHTEVGTRLVSRTRSCVDRKDRPEPCRHVYAHDRIARLRQVSSKHRPAAQVDASCASSIKHSKSTAVERGLKRVSRSVRPLVDQPVRPAICDPDVVISSESEQAR